MTNVFDHLSDSDLARLAATAADNCVKVSEMTAEERNTDNGNKGTFGSAGWASALVAQSLINEIDRRAGLTR